jgi:hypothetical protein
MADIAEAAPRESGPPSPPKEAAKKASKRRAKKTRKRARAKRSRRVPQKKSDGSSRRQRLVRSFPASSFEDALLLAEAIQKYAAGHRVRRLTIFDHLQKAPDSGWSRQLITNSSRYGLTAGSYQAEFLELTPEGRTATSPDAAAREILAARFRLAISQVEPFAKLYEQFKGNKVPNASVMRDFLVEQGYTEAEVAECVDTFLVNVKFLGILRTLSGAERLLPIEHVLEELPSSSNRPAGPLSRPEVAAAESTGEQQGAVDWTKICFYIAPIGADGSEHRKHSDLFLSSIVEPALEEFGLEVIRADQIGRAGMISRQVIEHIVRAKLVIADLSFHNPNVFYELALRHACRLPTVQIMRSSDKLPFDLDQVRTIRIDTSDIYTLVPQLQTHQSAIATQVRRAMSEGEAVDNPIVSFFPTLKVTF